MEFNELNYKQVKRDSNSCPNWVFIDLVHECSGEWGINWCESLLQFAKDLDNYIYGEINHGEEFYVSIKGSKYLIGDEVIEDASLVIVVHGYNEEDDLNPFYDSWIKYELMDEKQKIANDNH